MAKNKVEVDVEVDDNGTLKDVANKSKKAAKGLDETAKGGRNADRAMKGASRQSSNSTKNFSKMAQGMTGTLVPAYAILAANLFAVSAAYNFLKGAADMKSLEEGQAAYARSTGIAMKSLSGDIMAAAGAQLSYRDAAQAASIGLASGLTRDQLVDLGKAAKNTSLILGRDVTDSFNRLIRGVTKAEPELLDELGIILRLENATTNYANALGKNAKELTQFERSQAVAVDVLQQVEDKYNSSLKGTELLGNSVSKLGKTFQNDLLKPLQIGIANVLNPLVTFLTNNVFSLAAALTLFALPIFKALIPGFKEWGETAKASAKEAKEGLEGTRKALDAKVKALKDVKIAENDNRKVAQAAAREQIMALKARKNSGLATLQVGGDITEAQRRGMLASARKNAGEYKLLDDGVRKNFIKNLEMMNTGATTTSRTIAGRWNIMAAQSQVAFAKIKLAWGSTMAFMKTSFATMVAGVNFLVKTIAIVGWIILAVEGAKALYNWGRKLLQTDKERREEAQKELEAQKLKNMKFALEGVNSELEEMAKKEKIAGVAGAAFLGNAIKNTNLLHLRTMLLSDEQSAVDEAQKSLKSYAKMLETSGNTMGEAGERATVLAASIASMSKEQIKNEGFKNLGILLSLLSQISEEGSKAAEYIQAVKDRTEAETGLRAALTTTTQYDSTIKSLGVEIKLAGEIRKTLGKEELATLKKSEALRAVLVSMREREFVAQKRTQQLEKASLIASFKATPLQKERLSNIKEQLSNRSKILDMERESANIIALAGGRDNLTAGDLQRVTILEMQRDLMREQNAQLEEQITTVYQLGEAARTSFESGTTGALSALIKGENSSFKKAIADITLATLGGVADTIAKQLSLSFSDLLFGSKEDKIKQAHIEGIQEGFRKAGYPVSTGGTPSTTKDAVTKAITGTQGGGIKEKGLGYFFKKGGLKSTAEGDVFAERSASGGVFGRFIDDLGGLFKSGSASEFITNLGGVFASAGSGFMAIFEDLLGGLFGSGGAGSSALSGIVGSLFSSGATARNGGVFGPQMASGGVARGSTSGYPATLHGTEAVVPLPNNRSIPVDLKGAGQNNSVTVNVSVDSNGNARQDTQATSNQGANLGAAIAAAVQKELQNQKRSGGILNPYGAS